MRHDPNSVMIFAAGLGTRMLPLSKDRPKALVEVCGKPLINHALSEARAIRAHKIVVNTHAHAQMLESHLAPAPDVQICREEMLLETGGGLRAALPILGVGPVFTLNSDAVWHGPPALKTLKAHWDEGRMDALLLLVPPNKAHAHSGSGSFTLAQDGQITAPGPLIYTGAQIVQPAMLLDCPEEIFSIRWLWTRAAEKGRLFGCLYQGAWADVGTPEGIAVAEQMVGAC